MEMDALEREVLRLEAQEGSPKPMDDIEQGQRLGLDQNCPNKETPDCGNTSKRRGKREVWAEIESFMALNSEEIYILGEDFNVILELAEKEGGVQVESIAQKDFKSWVCNNNVLDIHLDNG
ncbi:hypothetical protein SUGI_1060420 [Cryptomeria japonica]|nr:hypothetical protein SUGI_1060420 [Cryptomeria japonica]